MKRNINILNVGLAVLALSTALSAAADPSVTDAQAQAGALLTAGSHFHSTQAGLSAGAGADVQSQARAIISGTRGLKATRLADNAPAPSTTHASTPLAHRATQKNTDAQSMAATVLLGRGA